MVQRRRRDELVDGDVEYVPGEEHMGSPQSMVDVEMARSMRRTKELQSVNHPSHVGFSRGNILSLRMTNIMTFASVELIPGPRLNMIIGPNGAGKSTIVNALCMVFGGSLSILGRSRQVGSYIKHGETHAYVEAIICDENARSGVRSIRREFTKDRNSWIIDDMAATKGDVDKLRASYDIQLDNLTQFLPQEKIAQFTELTETDLLKSTIAALGGNERVIQYDGLLNEHVRLQHMVNKSVFDSKQLEELRAKNKGIEPDVALFHERQQILNNIKLMEMLRPWVEFEVHREEVQSLKEIVINMDKELKQLKEQYNTDMAPLREKEEQLEGQKESIRSIQKQAAKCDKNLTKALEQCEEATAQFDAARDGYHNVDARVQERRRQIDQMEAEIESLEDEMRSFGDQEEARERMNETKKEKLTISTDLSLISEESAEERRRRREIDDDINANKQRLKRLDDKKTRKLEMLTRDHYDLHKALRFIQENEDRFRGAVIGPVALEVNTDNNYHARILSTCIPKWLQYAFLVETPEDQSLLSRTISEQRWDINCVTVPSQNARFDLAPIENVRRFGIYATALDCFEASENIKRLLAAHCNLHSILVGDETSTRNTEAISRSGVYSYFTPEANYSVRKSRYSNQVSSRSQPLPDHGGEVFMGVADNASERQNINAALEALHADRESSLKRENEILQRQRDMHAKLGEVDHRFNMLRRNLEKVNKVEQAIRSRQNALKSHREASTAEKAEEEKQKLLEEMLSLEESCRRKNEVVFESVMTQVKLFGELDAAVALQGDYSREVDVLTQHGRELDSQIQTKREEGQNRKEQLREEVRKLQELSEKAKKACPNPSDYKEKWDAFPQELDELDTEIRTERARADTIMGISPDLIEEYRRRKQQIEELEKRVSTNAHAVEEKKHGLEETKADFSRWLRENVALMSERFTALYQQIGCAGELKLLDEEVDRIHLEIHVSYRSNHEMRVLSGQTHSGGERMVATMLYHFALQNLTPAPFRVVDEMNQGMDPVFERKLLEIMLNDAREGASPQCFLITPKLLLDLSYNQHTVTHIILNGDIDAKEFVQWYQPQ